jgi:hypothetical protein
LHNEELSNLYSSKKIIRIMKSRWMRWAMHVVQFGEVRNAYKMVVGKREGKRPRVDLIYVSQDRDQWQAL